MEICELAIFKNVYKDSGKSDDNKQKTFHTALQKLSFPYVKNNLQKLFCDWLLVIMDLWEIYYHSISSNYLITLLQKKSCSDRSFHIYLTGVILEVTCITIESKAWTADVIVVPIQTVIMFGCLIWFHIMNIIVHITVMLL